jgi:hypothetical protein
MRGDPHFTTTPLDTRLAQKNNTTELTRSEASSDRIPCGFFFFAIIRLPCLLIWLCNEQAQTEVAGVAQRDGAGDGVREAEPKKAAWAALAVVTQFHDTAELELERTKPWITARVRQVLDLHGHGEVWVSGEIFSQDKFHEIGRPRRGVEELGGVAFSAATLQMPGYQERCRRDPDTRFTQGPGVAEVGVAPQPDQEGRELEVAVLQAAECVDRANFVPGDSAGRVDDDVVEATVAVVVGGQEERVAVLALKGLALFVLAGENAGTEPRCVRGDVAAILLEFSECAIPRHETPANDFGEDEGLAD